MRRGMASKVPVASNHYFGSLRIRMKTSVIFSTYNSPDWMEKVLWGFFAQTERDFEIIIADDGSREDTRERIERLSADT